MFTCAIVKTPCKNMVKEITTANLGKPDYKLALQQHAKYIEALELYGLTITILELDENLSDSTFIEDTCIITQSCAIITNHGTFDTGDIMMVKSHYYAGLSKRTSIKGALQLKNILAKYKFTSSTIKLE